jgi:hypothetical protein
MLWMARKLHSWVEVHGKRPVCSARLFAQARASSALRELDDKSIELAPESFSPKLAKRNLLDSFPAPFHLDGDYRQDGVKIIHRTSLVAVEISKSVTCGCGS